MAMLYWREDAGAAREEEIIVCAGSVALQIELGCVGYGGSG